ncbi:hypothetical protein BBJ28_00001464 [Nothophytophthora sp. Chile5]|nr:hypothetical protein BBJ28_00001464 [Nothophytophthora sp. Chile5]
MVNYGALYRPKHRHHKSSSASRVSEAPSTASTAPLQPESDAWATSSGRSHFSADVLQSPDEVQSVGRANGFDSSSLSSSSLSPSATNEPYFHFSELQQDALLQDARANAAALVVDAVANADKWQFVTAKGPLNVYELRADAADRVSSMVPPDASLLPHNTHTMLATSRVRATLDDFMRIFACPQRESYQNVLACLFEDRVQLADVFTSFGEVVRPARTVRRSSSTSSSASSRGSQQSASGRRPAPSSVSTTDPEQYAIKYVSIKGRSPRTNSSQSLSASASSNALKFGGKNRHRQRRAARMNGASATGAGAPQLEDEGLTMCLAEYATICRGQIPAPSSSDSDSVVDHRIGIISQHSMEDPAVTRYCKPIMSSSTSSLSASSGFAVASRALAQFSGIVVYPVASSVAGENVLEVLVKLSCYDAAGITASRRQNMLAYLTAFQALSACLLVMRLRDSPFVTSENWVRSRTRKCCIICQAGFSISRRKHHCRLCGDVACSKCSSVHQIKLGKAGKCPFRICAHCEHGVAAEGSPSRLQPALRPREASRTTRTPPSPELQDPEMQDEDEGREPSTNSSSGDSSDLYDSRGLLAVSRGGRSSAASSRGLGTSSFAKSGSSKTLSISSSNLSNSFYNRSNTSNATTASSSRGSRFELENEPEAAEAAISEVEPELTVEETASVCSSTSSTSPSSVVMQSEQFYKRFSELSLMDFHDSEFDLALKGTSGRLTTKSEVFDFDDSEADADSDRDDLDGIGEEDEGEEEEEEEDICDLDVRELEEDDSGMEFHDSNVGLDFQLQDLNLQDYRGLEELEEEDEYEDVQEIHTALARVPAASSLDEERALRLAEYGIMDSGKEHIYDLVAKQAAQHASCGLATISFVDATREFIKSSFGVAFTRDRELSEIPIAHSLTAEIMRRFPAHKGPVTSDFEVEDDDGEVVVVLDARADPVLAANLFVSDAPGLRFIMGVPFRSRDGVVLGALIVADAQPRTSAASRQQSQLKDLAEQVSALLEDRWTRNESAQSSSGQLRDQLVDLLSQSYSTGLQLKQNERQILKQSASSLAPLHQPQYVGDYRHLQSVEL